MMRNRQAQAGRRYPQIEDAKDSRRAGIVGLGTGLLLVLLVAFRLLVSLGNERGEATTPAIASPTQKPISSLPTYQVDPDSVQVNLPCHTDLTLEQSG